MPNVPALGLSPDLLAPASRDGGTALTMLRPYVRVELAASIVPGDPLDENRWYRYVGGVALGEEPSVQDSGMLAYIDNGAVVPLSGPAGIISASASDGFSGQGASLTFHLTGLAAKMLPRLRPMDRLRLRVVLPGQAAGWVVFDGFLRAITTDLRAGSGWSATLSLDAAGLQYLLGAAIFNWQGFIWPSKDILWTPDGTPLAESLGQAARAPHLVIQAFLRGAIGRSMGLRPGFVDGSLEQAIKSGGLAILDYMLFDHVDSARDFASWPGVAFPMPWSLIQSQTGASLWQVVEAVAEPALHEIFVGYRTPTAGGPARPTIIHRPRPFPGTADFDSYWKALAVRKVGAPGMPGIMGASEQLSADRRPNAFHWTGLGLGDHSKQAFEAKLAWGWAASNALINRYGYASYGVSSKLAPIEPGAPLKDYLDFSKVHLLHYAMQEVALPLLRGRSVSSPFLPVRPGEVLEDHTLGSDLPNIVTGYVSGTSWRLTGTGDSFSMSFTATVDRCLRGTDALGYPDAVRALVPDMKLYQYAGRDVGALPPPPAVGGTYTPPQVAPPAPAAIPNDIYAAVKAASTRQAIPAWLIAHILHNETAFGRFWGSDPASIALSRPKGLGQITSTALSDLTSSGYTNPDGSAFTSAQRGDTTLNVHATAGFLKRCQSLIEAQPGGFPSNGQSYYSWVARAYRLGATDTRTFASSTGWTWPGAGEPYPDYERYWSPQAILNAQAIWGWLG